MQAVIMAGGKGTRLRNITGDLIPKPMVKLAGKPLLEWQIETLRENNFNDILIITGYLGDIIQNYFGDGKNFGVKINYFNENQPLGTAGALSLLQNSLEDNFLLTFGDLIFDIDIERMIDFHFSNSAIATLFAHPNDHPYDSDLILHEANGRITGILPKSVQRDYWYDNCVNAGLYVISKKLCSKIPYGIKSDLEHDVLATLIHEGNIYAYTSSEYIKDVGTPERLEIASENLLSGMINKRCLKNPQRCIFMDRDGTINQYRGLISREEDFELEPFAAEAIKKINRSGCLAVVITNQPVVARGLCSVSDVENIHNKMKTLLGLEGAYLDEVYFCPHHPDKGYPEENPAYKISCNCRKPGVELISRCAKKYNIDLSKSFFIGDSTIDIQTGKNAGMNTILVMTGQAGKDGKYNAVPDLTARNLLEAVNIILERV